MNLIDSTYFQGDLLIPNLNSNTSVGDALRKELDNYIRIFQYQYLKRLLGKDLADEFIAGLEAQSVEQKWTNLKNKLVDETNIISPISGYVYYFFATSKRHLISTENAVFGTNDLIVKNWNDMYDMTLEVYEYLNDYSSTYNYDESFNFRTINNFGF